MVPREYMEVVVLPTVRDYLRTPNDRRLAYLSAISAYHMVDYLMRTASPADRAARNAETKRIESEIIARCPNAFHVVEGICNGTKHCGRDITTKAQFTPGDETLTRPFGFGPGFAGFGEGTFGPQRILVEHNGERHVVDEAVIQFLRACQDAFPTHLTGIDLSGMHVSALVGFTLAIRRPAFLRQILRPTAASLGPRPVRASRSTASIFQALDRTARDLAGRTRPQDHSCSSNLRSVLSAIRTVQEPTSSDYRV